MLLVKLDEPSGPYGSESPSVFVPGALCDASSMPPQPLAWVLWLLMGEAKYRGGTAEAPGGDTERDPLGPFGLLWWEDRGPRRNPVLPPAAEPRR